MFHFTSLDLTVINPALISICYRELVFVYPILASTHSRSGCSSDRRT